MNKINYIIAAGVLTLAGVCHGQSSIGAALDKQRKEIDTLQGEITQLNKDKITALNGFLSDLNAEYSAHKDLIVFLSQKGVMQQLNSATDQLHNMTANSGVSAQQFNDFKSLAEARIAEIITTGVNSAVLSLNTPPTPEELEKLVQLSGSRVDARDDAIVKIQAMLMQLTNASHQL